MDDEDLRPAHRDSIDELVAFDQLARAPLQLALKSLTKSNTRARQVLGEAERRLTKQS